MSDGQRFRHHGIAGRIFEPRGSTRAWCLNLPGLPGRPDGTPIVPFLTSRGFSVVQPQYAGSFDSDGSFDPAASWETVAATLELMRNGTISDGSRAELSVAHSFGTHALIRAILQGADPGLRVVLLSPMIEFGARTKDGGIRVDLDAHAEQIARLMPHTYRLIRPDVLRDFFLGRTSYLGTRQEASAPTPATVLPAFLACGDSDAGLDAGQALRGVRARLEGFGGFDVVAEFVAPNSGHSVGEMLENGLDSRLDLFLQE